MPRPGVTAGAGYALCVATFSSSSMCTEEGGSHLMLPCDIPRPGVDIARGGGGGASERARRPSALSEHENARKFPFPRIDVFRESGGRCFSLLASSASEFSRFLLGCRLVEPSASASSLLAARSGRSDPRTPSSIQTAPRDTGRRTQRRHTRGAGSCDGGGQTGRGRARRRGRGGCAERTRRVHRAELHERRAREGCDRGASRGTAPATRARSRRAIGLFRVSALRAAREIRLSIWNRVVCLWWRGSADRLKMFRVVRFRRRARLLARD